MNDTRHEEVAYLLAELLGHPYAPPRLRELLAQYLTSLVTEAKMDSPTTVLALYPVLQRLGEDRGVGMRPEQEGLPPESPEQIVYLATTP